MKGTGLVIRAGVVFAVILGAALYSCAAKLPDINTTADGLAIKGYDPVAYFTEGKPVKGFEGFEYEWKGARWRFSSVRNMELFMSDPEKYAPQYGGY